MPTRLRRRARSSAGSGRRPAPTSPPARWPTSGSSTCTPRRRSTSRLSCTAGCSHISVCIAGHRRTGARVASSVAVSRPSGVPVAYDAIRRAVAGATTIKSALWPRRVCGLGSPLSYSEVSAGSEATAENVAAPTKLGGVGRENRRHVRARVDESAADLYGLVCGDAAAYPQNDPSTSDRHRVTRPDASPKA